MKGHGLECALPYQRWPAHQSVIHHATKSVDVRSGIESLRNALLGAHVPGTSEGLTRFGNALRFTAHRTKQLGNSEIHNFDEVRSHVTVGKQYVARLQIAMDDALVMRVRESVAHLHEN